MCDPNRALGRSASARVRVGALSLSFEMNNLLDVQSEDLDGYPLPPRAAFVTLGITWDAVPERKS